MKMSSLKSTLVAEIYDRVATIQYGDGLLVETPFTYSDGDSVTVYVEPMGEGVRVTDREEAIDRLEDAGVELERSRRARAEWDGILQEAGLVGVGASEFEISHATDAGGAARAVFDVAETAQKVEQLRYLAREMPLVLYRDVVVDSTRAIADRHKWRVRRSSEVTLSTGARRKLTAIVQTTRSEAFVQALSTADAVASTFLTFSYLPAPKEARLAVIDERTAPWKKADLEPIGDVSTLVHYRTERDLAGALEDVDQRKRTVFA